MSVIGFFYVCEEWLWNVWADRLDLDLLEGAWGMADICASPSAFGPVLAQGCPDRPVCCPFLGRQRQFAWRWRESQILLWIVP